MGRRSRSRSASHSPSRSSRRAPASASSSTRRRREDDSFSSFRSSHRHRSRSRSKSRSPHRRHGGGSSRRRSSSDLDANDTRRKKQKTERNEHGDDTKGERSSANGAGDPGAVKANTMEKNGEISMSIEETNRVRAALGLKPLSLGPKKKDENVVNLQKTSDQVDEERERAGLQKKLAQSKKKRELTQKLAGQSIGEQLKASASGSALDWVKQSRAKVDDAAAEEKKSKKTAKKKRQTVDEQYDASALAGMVVGHDIKSFEEGDEVVLTLKDSRVLAQDGNDLNDEQDELVNVELSERDRRHAEKQRAQRAMMPAYTGFDDDEFIQMGKSNRMKKPARLLSQYDDDDDRKALQQAQKFTLDASGSTKVASGDDAHGANDEDLDNDIAVVSLAMDKTKSIDEYYTQEEIDAQFSKKKSKKLRKKKKLRHQQTAEEQEAAEGGEGAGGESAASLVQQLEAEALKNASKDRGRRRRRVEEDDDSKQSGIEEENLLRFQEARERANATASNALQAMTGTKKKRRPVALDDDVLDDAMDMELSASLAQTRRLAQLKEATHVATGTESSSTAAAPSVITSEDRIAALVNQTIGVEPSITDVISSVSTTTSSGSTIAKSQVAGHVFGESLQNLESSGNVVVFNEATDFEMRLKNAMEQRSAQFQAATMEAATAQLGRQAEPAGVVIFTQPTASRDDGDEEMKGEAEDENGEEEEEETKDGEVWGEEQPLVGSGMAATLALLRKTGDLRETRVERQAGRANDARDRNVDEELRVKDGVKLDYRDEFGRLLTKKEAFRLLSYKFHGHEPGKKKKEKRLKQLKEELEAQKMLSGEGSTKMMKVLEKKQKVSKQAHVVLSGGT